MELVLSPLFNSFELYREDTETKKINREREIENRIFFTFIPAPRIN